MPHRIVLPDGGWADIAEPADLSNRARKTLRRLSMPAMALADKFPGDQDEINKLTPAEELKIMTDVGADGMDLISDMQAAYIVAYVTAWSLDLPLPTMDTVDDLPGPIFDALADATANLGDGTVVVTPDTALDAGSPTVPSPV